MPSKILRTFPGIAALCGAVPALAQDAELAISGNVAVTSEYRLRGVDYSGGDPAVQAGVDLAHGSGFYLGTWGSTLGDGRLGYGDVELDVYGGWSGFVAEGLTADLGLTGYFYPDSGGRDTDFLELYGSLSFDIGPATATAGVAYAPEQDGLGGQDNLYLYTDLGMDVPGTPLSLFTRIGHTDGARTFTADGSAWDYAVGGRYAFSPRVTATLSYVGAGGRTTPHNVVGDGVVGTIGLNF